MPFEQFNSENKQHINLSQKAWNIINDDMLLFQINSKSGFLNQIIANYNDKAAASISISVNRELDNYKNEFNTFNQDIREEMKKFLKDIYIKRAKERIHQYEIGEGIKFRINKENARYLTEECNEDLYYDTVGKYLKALIEEYCEKSYLEREQIVFADFFQCIETAIQTRKQLKIQLNNQQYIHVKPFSIETDPLSMYHYLVGYSVDPKTGQMQSFSLRITSAKRIRKLEESAFISAEHKKLLSKEIHDKGPQFMSTELLEVVVYLTDEGIKKYQRLLHLRPRSVSPLSNDRQTLDYSRLLPLIPHKNTTAIKEHIYTFHCTKQQIEYYFFKFGSDAIILSPNELRFKFRRMYDNAFHQYNMD